LREDELVIVVEPDGLVVLVVVVRDVDVVVDGPVSPGTTGSGRQIVISSGRKTVEEIGPE